MPTCQSCNSTNVQNIDGLFYCTDCGTQNRALREVDTEQDTFMGYVSILKTPAPKKAKEDKKSAKPEEPLGHLIAPTVDYPEYLDKIGERLTTATYLLVKITDTLQKDFNLPSEIMDASLSLFHQYLASFDAAFTEKEVGDGANNYIYQTKKNMTEMDLERQTQTQELKDQKKREIALERSQLPQWQQSFLEQTNANSDEEINEALLIDINMIKNVQTTISKDAFRMCGLVPVNMDILICIVYFACQHFGCNWILLTDLHRWHREDRFSIFGRDAFNLSLATVVENPDAYNNTYKMSLNSHSSPVSNACDLYRLQSIFMQTVKIPKTLFLPTIDKMLHRLVFDLNLPACFWNRLQIVLKFLPPVTSEVTIEMLSQSCEFMTGEALIKRILSKRCKEKEDMYSDRTFYRNWMVEKKDLLATIPIETKAAAIIMFALKLMFGLDDKTEHEIDKFSSTQLNNFKFDDWLYQVEFRNYSRDGTAVETILSPTFSSAPPLHNEKIISTISIPGRMFHSSHDHWIIPKRSYYGEKDKPYYACFPVDRLTTTKASFSNLSKYAPLRFHGKYAEEIGSNTPNIDPKRLEIYLRRFNKNDMEFDSFHEIGPTDLPDELAFCDLEWRKCFPALCRFKRLPMSTRLSYWPRGKPLITMKFLEYRLRDERRTFSESFERLLAAMSMTISEKSEVLYLAFTAVEAMFENPNLGVDLIPSRKGVTKADDPSSVEIDLLEEELNTNLKTGNDSDDSNNTDDLLSNFSDSMVDDLADSKKKPRKLVKNEAMWIKMLKEKFW